MESAHLTFAIDIHAKQDPPRFQRLCCMKRPPWRSVLPSRFGICVYGHKFAITDQESGSSVIIILFGRN